jgi:hypothetical protein
MRALPREKSEANLSNRAIIPFRCIDSIAAASRSSSLGASQLQRRTGFDSEFFSQPWWAVEIKQALTDVVGGCRGFRQGAPLTARLHWSNYRCFFFA